MKLRLFTLLISAALAVTGISGCTLAREDGGMNGTNDRLIGIFVTDEYLDLFDFDAYMNDHSTDLLKNRDTVITPDDKYDGRLYASIEKHDSDDPDKWEVDFGDLKGEYGICPVWMDENGEDLLRETRASDGISDTHLHINVTDEGEEQEISFSICMVPAKEDDEAHYYANPVYQTSDGEIYVVSGDGFLASTVSFSQEGEYYSTTLSDTVTVKENKKTKAEKSSVTLKYMVMFEPTKITLYQMNERNEIISTDTYRPGDVPETITAMDDTAYFLIETEKVDPQGREIIMRDLYEKSEYEEESLMTWYVLDNGLLGKQETQIIWGK